MPNRATGLFKHFFRFARYLWRLFRFQVLAGSLFNSRPLLNSAFSKSDGHMITKENLLLPITTLSNTIRSTLYASCASILLAPSALAVVLVDDFSTQDGEFLVFADAGSVAAGSPGVSYGSAEEANRDPALTLGGHRFFEGNQPILTGFSFAYSGRVNGRGFFDLAVEGPAVPSTAMGRMTWDGNGTLNADLSAQHRFVLDVFSVEYETSAAEYEEPTFNLWVGVSSASGSDTVARSITAGTGAQLLSWDFSDFNGVDFSSVDAIMLTMEIDFEGEGYERYTVFMNEFTAVPEPLTTAGFSAAALLGFAIFRRRSLRA